MMGSAPDFDHEIRIQVLESQALRTLVLAILFGVAALFVVLTGVNFYLRYGWEAASTPATVLVVTIGVAFYELGMRRAIKRHIGQGTTVPTWVWYANACVEISVMTAIMVFIHGSLSNPIFALSTPPLLGYFLFIILSTLYLDARLSIFTGGLAAAQYLTVVLVTFADVGSNAAGDAIFFTPGIYLAKTTILVFGGMGAALVARELLRRHKSSLLAVEDRNREQQANTMKSQFLADMSHEIRTPLNAVIGYAQLLETDGPTTPNQRKAIEAIRVGGRHLLGVINDVLDISKIEAGSETVTAARFNLTALLQEMTLIFAARCAEKRLSWIFDMDSDAGEVAGDEAKLRQVLTNILGNAVKFTQSGHVALRVSTVGQDLYRFEVEDTGPGIPEDLHRDIFDPFAQEIQGRLEGGTGLGLAIAQRYVRLMGGDIAVTSAPGAGSRFSFTIRLPENLSAGAAASVGARPSVRKLSGDQVLNALVVDDIVENRDVLATMLANAGITVETAEDGESALEKIAGSAFDIVFLDIRMPGMSGIDVARRIPECAQTPVKVVAVSASALAHQQADYRDAGFHGFLDKPVQMENLFTCIEELLSISFEPVAGPTPKLSGESRPHLPGDLHRALADAAKRHNITELKRHISELETLGDPERIFASDLRELCGTYDMNAVLSALAESDHE